MDLKTIFGKTGTIVAAALSIALMGASATSAATFDFVSMADVGSDDNFIGAREDNFSVLFPAGITIDGITLIASGTNVSGATADAFFDKGSAGLGVCSSLSCSTQDGGDAGTDTSDDNVTLGETLTLNFGKIVNITDIFFNNSDHPPLTGQVGLNGGLLTIAGGLVTSGQALLSGSQVYNFSFFDSGSNDPKENQFYIASVTVSPVPLPAGMVLLLTGFGALGVARRRKTAAAA
jgi:hypothetical protein